MTLMVLVGGTFDRSRIDEARRGRLPRNDLTEFAERSHTDLFDFDWLRNHGRTAPLFRALCRLTDQWSLLLAARAFVHAGRYSSVYATGEDVGVPFAILSRLAVWRRQKVVMRVENISYGASKLKSAVWNRALRIALRRTDSLVCRSSRHAGALAPMATLKRTNIITLGSEVDTTFYRPEADEDPDARRVVPDVSYILSAGLEMRDYRTLFDAVEGLPVRLVVGAGSPWSKDAFDVDALPENVTVGRYSLPEMRELYRNALAIVLSILPTDRCCGLSVIGEAWSMGRPVVAATDGLRETVIEAGSIAIVPGDVAGLRAAILSVVESPERQAELGRLGLRYAQAELDLDRFVARIDALVS